MEIEILKQDKKEVELKINNVTIAEVLRVYLNEEPGVEFAAWKREHPSKPLTMSIKSEGNVSKMVGDAISVIKKDCDKIVSGLKK